MNIKWDKMEEHIQSKIEIFKHMFGSDVRFVGIRICYLVVDDDMLIQEGLFEDGFEIEEYE